MSAREVRSQCGVSACEDCGLPYEQFPLDVVLPDADWLLIHPSGDGGLLCAGCIATRASRLATTIILSARIVNAADHDTYSSLKNATWASLAAARSALPPPELEALSVADTQSLLGADRPISIGKVPTDPIGMRALAAIVRHRVRCSQELPAFWRCTACGCLWRDNRVFHDESVSLSSAKQTSCPECEMKPTAEVCEPLFRQPNVAALPPPQIDIVQRLAALEWVLNRAEEIVRDEHGKDAAYSFEQAWGELPKTLRTALPRAPEPDLESIVRAWLADPHRQFATTGSRYTTVATHELELLAEALRASRREARVPPEQEQNDDARVETGSPELERQMEGTPLMLELSPPLRVEVEHLPGEDPQIAYNVASLLAFLLQAVRRSPSHRAIVTEAIHVETE